MKRNRLPESLWKRDEVIATFGQVQLIRTRDGKCQLKGGTKADRPKARKWVAMFVPEALRYLGK
jgi:hypothetical protein